MSTHNNNSKPRGLHKPRDPYFSEMVKKKQGSHKDKTKVLPRKVKHRGQYKD